jgi:cyclopropane fatty-acyl-phospholipid synthase-like methyltransferase
MTKNVTFEEKIELFALRWGEDRERLAMAAAFASAMHEHLHLRPDLECLEFGCGRGNLALLLPEELSILAADTSAEAIEVLKDKIAALRSASIVPVHGDILELEAAGRFDLIYSTMALHHIEDTAALLAKCAGMLREKGRLVLADLDREDGSFHEDKTGVFHFGFDRDELKRLLFAAGFVPEHLDEVYRRVKTAPDGAVREYPIFMAVAKKRQ